MKRIFFIISFVLTSVCVFAQDAILPDTTMVDPVDYVFSFNILIGIVMGAAYSIFIWLRKRQGDQPFDKKKFFATVLVGAFVGLIAAVKGIKFDEQYLETQLLAYGGSIIAVQNGIQIILRAYNYLRELLRKRRKV